ncbi:MAG: CbiQ family ECF transporter T component, partial [Candidatus Hydrothermia bacterium]
MSFARKNLKIIGRLAFPGPINRGGPSPFFKILMVLTGVLVSTLVHDRLALALLLLMALAFALAWKARPSSLLKRLGPLILFFAVILPLPAIFIPVGSHEPVRLWILPIYANGLSAAITLCLRTSSAICWAGAGFLTEEPHKLLSALPLPSVLADIILGAHRYISLLAREAWEMFLGKLARDPVGGFRSNLLFMGSRVGLLFVRSADTGEKVYLAMRARGYPG